MGLTRRASVATLALALSLPLLAQGRALSRAYAEPGPSTVSPDRTGISLEALAVLSEAQRALVDARELAAKLDEPAALSRLLATERALREILQVPGVHAWLAEVWLQMALVAAQRGELGLADSLFAHALTLDPTRHVGAAEAAPPIIARSEAVARARDAAQRSRFRIEPSPDDASCWIDGRRRGEGSIEVDLAPGLHLLLLEAPGYLSQGMLIDALSGARRPFVLALAPTPETERRLSAAASTPKKGVLATRSDKQDAIAPHQIPAKSRWWKRWPVWVSAASVAVASGIAIGFASRDERKLEQRTLSVDPGVTEP